MAIYEPSVSLHVGLVLVLAWLFFISGSRTRQDFKIWNLLFKQVAQYSNTEKEMKILIIPLQPLRSPERRFARSFQLQLGNTSHDNSYWIIIIAFHPSSVRIT